MKRMIIVLAALFMVCMPVYAGQESITPEEMYQQVLNDYTEVINRVLNGEDVYQSLSGKDVYDLNRSFNLDYYWSNTSSNLPRVASVKCAVYDIDQNGVMELLIGDDSYLIDAFSYDGNRAVRIVDSLGRSQMTLYQNGILEECSYGGQTSVYCFYRMSVNGHAMDKIDELRSSYNQYSRNGVAISKAEFQQKISEYEKAPKAQLSWIRLLDVADRGFTVSSARQENGTPEEMYQLVLNDYTEVINMSLKGLDVFQLRISYDVNDYWLSLLPSVADEGYVFYDIDQNGVIELFIGGDGGLTDAFGYDGNKAVRLMELPGRGEIKLYQNGIIETYSHGGWKSKDYRFYQMSANGYTMDKVDELIQSDDQYSRNGIEISESEFWQIIDGYEKVPMAQLPWMRFPVKDTP